MKEQSVLVGNILKDLEELSDIEYQRHVWLGRSTMAVSSFTELYCRLFDDDNFDAFVDRSRKELNMPDKIHKEVSALRTLLNKYDDSGKEDDFAILEDPVWHVIVLQSKKVLILLLDWLKSR